MHCMAMVKSARTGYIYIVYIIELALPIKCTMSYGNKKHSCVLQQIDYTVAGSYEILYIFYIAGAIATAGLVGAAMAAPFRSMHVS